MRARPSPLLAQHLVDGRVALMSGSAGTDSNVVWQGEDQPVSELIGPASPSAAAVRLYHAVNLYRSMESPELDAVQAATVESMREGTVVRSRRGQSHFGVVGCCAGRRGCSSQARRLSVREPAAATNDALSC